MKIQTLFRVMMVLGVAGMLGCGGGGGGGSSPGPAAPVAPAKATTTLSGKVEFPSLSSLVAKRANAVAAITDPVSVQAYSIDGVAVGNPVTADGSGNFTITGLDSGVDYVLKATRGPQVLKKLIEKVTVAPGATVLDQNISGVSTAAVVVASQKLATAAGVTTFNLGEPATLSETQKTALSAKIFTDISPKDLETTITSAAATVQAAITANDLSTLTKTLADLVNTLNITLAAVSSNTDPTQVVNGQVQNFTVATDPNPAAKPLRLIEINAGVVTQAPAITNVLSTVVAPTVTSSVAAYNPPSRVQLDISSTVAADTMSGITLDIIIPADAKPKLLTLSADGLSYSVDLKSVSLAAGVPSGTVVDAQFITSTRKLRIVIAVGNENSFLQPGKLVTILFDRTVGVVVSAGNFSTTIVNAIDLNGNALLSGFTLTNTVTSSGL